MSATVLWSSAGFLYILFWVWYVGLRGKLSQAEVEAYLQDFAKLGASETELDNLRYFFEGDDGKEWFMVNVLRLKPPKAESSKLLDQYVRAFMPGLFKRAGHPVFTSRAVARNIENHHCEEADNWTIVALVRYRSRRDGAEILLNTFGSDHHGLKLASLGKTFAFPAVPIMLIGSPKIIVALVLALLTALLHIGLVV